MTINNARGSHSSPGIYTKEVDVTYSAKSLGITSLGLAGETKKGPAFEPIKISKWSEFEDYFGTTSAEKFKETGLPKYELPYIAKEYLKESKELYVCRALGLSGYNAGKAWVVSAKIGGAEYAVAVLRSKGIYDDAQQGGCTVSSGDVITWKVDSIAIEDYKETKYNGNCEEVTGETSTTAGTITSSNLGKFTIVCKLGTAVTGTYPVSLNYGDSDYIYNVIGNDPLKGNAPIFIEEVYDFALEQKAKLTTGSVVTATSVTSYDFSYYTEGFQCAKTPWFVSEVKAVSGVAHAKRLFRAYTISDGNDANSELKLSIEKVRPDDGTFDLVVRSFSDSDSAPVVKEKFSGCNLVAGDKNYVALRVGTIDGDYELKSKYIALEMNEDDEIAGSVPCGFMGYPLHSFGTAITNFPMSYNLDYSTSIKPKRQYFGMSNLSGIDVDVLTYKGMDSIGSGTGITALTEMSEGFHLDSIIAQCSNKCTIDGVEYKFECVNGKANKSGASVKIPRIVTEKYAEDTIYADVNVRKFTACFYGGFDGWDIYRESRTNTDAFKTTKYNGKTYNSNNLEDYLNLPTDAINSDYYAYLAAYRQFANPEAFDINVFATPGIDYENNELLVEDALDMIEDPDDGRNGDALHIVTAPMKGAKDGWDSMYTASEAVEKLDNTSIDSSYIATYWPWVKCFDSNDNVYVNLPVTKDVVRNLAYTDNNSYPWFAPAGVNRGNVDCVKACVKTKLADEDTLYDGRINPVKTFAVDGVKLWGNKTIYSVDSPLNRINSRRLMLRLKKLINSVSKQLIFDQYDNSLKTQFLGLVTPILSDVKSNRGISDYRIDIDDSAEARDAHTLPCTIHVKPVASLEYIDLTFTIYPESVSFQD